VLVVSNILSKPGNFQAACETGGEVEGVFNPPPMTGAMGEDERDWIKDMATSSLAADADVLVGGRSCDALVVADGIFPMPGAIGEDERDGIENMATSSLAADADSARGCDVLVVTNGVLPMPGNSSVACEMEGIKEIFNPPSMTGAIGEDGTEDMTTSSLAADADSA
jgi:hypothetical protein